MISGLMELLALYYHQQHPYGMLLVARSILDMISDDIALLQLMALAFLQLG